MQLTRSLWAAIALTNPSLVSAFWRMECGISQVGRIDPIVAPDTISSHVHKLSGGSNININSTYESMQESACTTCTVQADKSGYWTPQLYYQRGDGTFQEVQNGGTVVYYLGRGASADGSDTIPFPKGLQMLSGNPLARSYDKNTMTWGNSTYYNRPVSDRTSFVCIPDYTSGLQIPQTSNMAFDVWAAAAGVPAGQGNKVCMNGMRAQIQFPSCWDGVNLYKADGSHMAYLSQIDNGACPPTHPKLFMHLFYEMYYDVYDIDMSDGGRFVFAFGDTTGYGFHGDFLNGWDLDVLGAAVKQCGVLNPGGSIDSCPPLAAVNTNTNGYNCPLYAPYGQQLINETVTGNIGKKLPGCINIVTGPADATYADMTCAPSVPLPSINSFPEQLPVVFLEPTQNQHFGNNGWNYVDCFQDNINNTRVLAADQMTSTSLTIESCQTYCSNEGWRYAGLEFGNQCFCSSTIPTGYPGNQTCTQACTGNSTEICGGPGFISIFNNTLATTALAAPGAGPVSTDAGTYVGCVSEGNNYGRTLTGPTISSNNMTLETCRAFCTSQGYTLSGAEYSSQCYCGNSMTNGGALQSDSSSCNMLCSGNNMNMCGGPNRLSVYSANITVSSTMATATTSGSASTGTAAANSLSCPSNNGASFTVGSSTFQLNCAVDFDGGDMGMVFTSSVADCAVACSNSTGCLASSWVKGSPQGPCYMKSKVGNANPNGSVWAVKKLVAVASTTTTSAVQASATPKQCPADDGTTITVGSSSFTLQCATDHAGGDLSGVGSSSVEACAASCAATGKCVGASYLPGVCYMKQANGPAMANGAVWALVLNSGSSSKSSSSSASITSSALTTSSALSTSSSSSSMVSTSSSSSLSSTSSSSSLSSASSSSSTTSTRSTSSVPTTSSTSSLSTSTSSSSTSSVPTTSSTSFSSRSSTSSSSTSSITTTSSTSSSSTFTSSSSTSSVPTTSSSSSKATTSSTSSISSSSSSISSILTTSSTSSSSSSSTLTTSSTSSKLTTSSTTSSTTSTFTSSIPTTSSTSSKATTSSTSSSSTTSSTSSKPTTSSTSSSTTSSTLKTSSTTSSAATTTPTITCPANNNTLYSIYNTTTLLNTTYSMQCSVDHPGNAAQFSVATMYDCLTACANYANCTAVSYVAAGRACYLKTTLKPAGALNSAVWGAVVVSQTKGAAVAPVAAAAGASKASASATPVAAAKASVVSSSSSSSVAKATATAAPVTKAKTDKKTAATTKKNAKKNGKNRRSDDDEDVPSL